MVCRGAVREVPIAHAAAGRHEQQRDQRTGENRAFIGLAFIRPAVLPAGGNPWLQRGWEASLGERVEIIAFCAGITVRNLDFSRVFGVDAAERGGADHARHGWITPPPIGEVAARAVAVEEDTPASSSEQAVHAWINWMAHSMMSPHYGVHMVPPEGAHIRSFDPDDEHSGCLATLYEIARWLEKSAPELSRQMHWIETNGKAGGRPPLRSELIADYGPVFRHDFPAERRKARSLQNSAGRVLPWYEPCRNPRWHVGLSCTTAVARRYRISHARRCLGSANQ